ncbi:SARM1 [Cordylochernes scorpioides]|uniref:ADP-ribosyl cyclase/cyclic ADP-ribose hydrolase n=1 Tax=Cordylochernes scorpioides TaxID=51811 RepID=A0ABY6K6B4_9ARAC|nr:SARM1 [Cordylochernes scorpioides]
MKAALMGVFKPRGKLKNKCADAFRMLTVAYGEATLDRSNVYRWNKMFSEGREDVNDEERARRPSTSTTDEKINEVEKMILANRRITVREVAEDLNISIGSCHSIFINDLGMRRVAAKFVPKLLNCDQKQHRMNIANEMLDSVRDDPNFLQRVITGDEAWVYGYDVETKTQSSQWNLPHEPRPKKARQVRSNVEVLLTVFFDCRGVVHHEFLPQGRTVNTEYYLQVMRNLREAIRQKRPDLWKNKNWLLHHDNAPAHTSLLVRDFLAKNNTLMMPQPPYSPDLAPCDFFLFPKLKRPMKGRRYATLDEIKTASKEELKKIFKNDFLKCFEDWKNRWHNGPTKSIPILSKGKLAGGMGCSSPEDDALEESGPSKNIKVEQKSNTLSSRIKFFSNGKESDKKIPEIAEIKQKIPDGRVNREKKKNESSIKVATDAFSSENISITKMEQKCCISNSQDRIQQGNFSLTYSANKTVHNHSQEEGKNTCFCCAQMIDHGMTEQYYDPDTKNDFHALVSHSTPKEKEIAIVNISKTMVSYCYHLKISTDDKERIKYLTKINKCIRNAWAIPTLGHDLGFTMCNILRDNACIDIMLANCYSSKEDMRLAIAQVFEQCLSTENRDYVVKFGLSKIIALACAFAETHEIVHMRLGTGILEHLFKHSEETCSIVIKMGGLNAILGSCRSCDIETLRHCAAALANLSLYGGPENHRCMIQMKVPLWIFPLAFQNDDNIKYYACLAISVLVANKEIEAAVLISGTLTLVEPFVTSHDPDEFSKSTVAHFHGQSKSWLQRLVPVLESKREEARNLAAFHFAMEAGIKSRQGNTQIFTEIGAVDALKKVASSPNAIASRFAAQALRMIGEAVPRKLSQQVPVWAVEDVEEWIKQVGFSEFVSSFAKSRVDGDLLLQLDDKMLLEDIGMENGILRRRFLRDLEQLKCKADYASCDSTDLNGLLQSIGPEFSRYTYQMLQSGVQRTSLSYLTDEQLEQECGVHNSIHRHHIAQVFQDYKESSRNEADEQITKTIDVFISYRRSNGSQLASLLKVLLQLRGFSVFIDVERLEAGKFDNNLLGSIRQARNFLLVLTPAALDRCVGDVDCKDWVHREVVAALQSQCKIIPITDNFNWPESDKLPEDMRSVLKFNAIKWIHDYQDACVDKLERFMNGDAVPRGPGGTPKSIRRPSGPSGLPPRSAPPTPVDFPSLPHG